MENERQVTMQFSAAQLRILSKALISGIAFAAYSNNEIRKAEKLHDRISKEIDKIAKEGAYSDL